MNRLKISFNIIIKIDTRYTIGYTIHKLPPRKKIKLPSLVISNMHLDTDLQT